MISIIFWRWLAMKKVVCKNCGSVNEVADEALKSSGDWIECDIPLGFEWTLPAGKIMPIMGEPIYITSQGEYRSRSAYLDEFGIDPEIALNLMRSKVKVQTASQILTNFKMAPVGIKMMSSQTKVSTPVTGQTLKTGRRMRTK